MTQLYCPYCNPRYFFPALREDGVYICGLCGDELVKKKTFKPIQILCIAALAAFISPLILMVSTAIYQQRKEHLSKPPTSTISYKSLKYFDGKKESINVIGWQ